jgi:hypothetical protein
MSYLELFKSQFSEVWNQVEVHRAVIVSNRAVLAST